MGQFSGPGGKPGDAGGLFGVPPDTDVVPPNVGRPLEEFAVKKIGETGAAKVIGGPIVKVIDFILGGGPGHIFQSQAGQGEEAAIADLAAREAAAREAAVQAGLRRMNAGLLQDMARTDP